MKMFRCRAQFVAVLAGLAWGQDFAVPPSFEAAVVKLNKSGEPFPERKSLPGGQLSLENYTMRELIAEAWGKRKDEILGGRAWFDSDRFDVIAKASPGTPDAAVRVMLQGVLKEQFKLAVHEEQKALPVYALVAGKHGPNLTPTTGGRTFCGAGRGAAGQLHRACTNMTMAALAEWLPKMDERLYIDLPVVDLTGTTGAYDFKLDWSPPVRVRPDGPRANVAMDPNGPTMFEAVRELGLNLERRQIPVPVVVVDRVERLPAGN